MAYKKILFRRDLAATWTSVNPVLSAGEIGLESDTGKIKLGDGSTVWTSLDYFFGSLEATNYVQSLIAGTGLTITGNSGTGSTPTLNIGQNIAVSSSPTFAQVTIDNLPVNDKHVATKAYVDGIAASINWHEFIYLATAAALPNTPTYDNSGDGIGATLTAGANARLVVDGTNASTGNRILVKNQTTTAHNGVYVVTNQGSVSVPWVLTRADDFDGRTLYATPHAGDAMYVSQGSTNSNQGFLVFTSGTGTDGGHIIGTDAIGFTQFSGTAPILAGTGITKNGNQLSIGQDVAATASVSFAGITTAYLNGVAEEANRLNNPVLIGGQSFDGSQSISLGTSDITGLTATATDLNKLFELGTTKAQLEYLNSASANIQTQINNRALLLNPTFFEDITANNNIYASEFHGNLIGTHTGNVVGDLTGTVFGAFDGSASGGFYGTLTGDVIGTLAGQTTGLHVGNVTGNLTGNVIGNVSGSVSGDVVGNVTGNVLGNVTGNLLGNVTGSVDGSISGNAATVSSISNHGLDALSDVSASSPTANQFLKWNGTAWVPDLVDLNTDTSGNYVASVIAGTGVSLTNGVAQEAGTPTISIGQPIGSSDSPQFAGLVIGNTNLTVNGNLSYNAGTNLVTVNTLTEHGLYVGARVTISGATQEGYNGDFVVSQVTSTTQFRYTPTLTPSSSISSGSPEAKFGGGLIFEGSSPDEYETYVTFANPTADRYISFPDATTILVGKDTTDTLTNKTLTNPVITGVSPILTLSGDVSGSVAFTDLGNATMSTAIQPNSVVMGTDTTGSYVANLVAGTGVTITDNAGESATPRIAIGQDVGTSACVQFETLVVTNLFATNQQSTNQAELNVSDSKIVLNAGTSGAPTLNGSIVIDRGSSSSVEIRWNEIQDRWEATRDGSNYKIIDAGAKMTLGTTPPGSPDEGDFWFETDSAITFVYYDGYWIEIGASGIGAVIGSSAPENPANGQFWFRNTTSEVFVYYDGEWVLVSRSTSTDDVGIASIMGAF
jgi:outer membrane lipoprotein SlyB